MPRRRRRGEGRAARGERGSFFPSLDLHGETAESARRIAARWLREQRDAGERMVRLITGRGKHSPAGPVLREEIRLLLLESTGGLVVRVEEESGGGAFRVELRSPSFVSAPRPVRVVDASPELRRQAEEALAELGVHPTPELVAAEIRRIRAERRGG